MSALPTIYLKDVMFNDPVKIKVDEPFSRVEKYFRMYHIRHLPVVDGENKLVGIVTQRDLLRFLSPKRTEKGEFVDDSSNLNQYPLQQVMRKEIVTLSENDTLAKAIDLIVTRKLGCIPVVDKEKNLKGIVTQTDILKAVSKYLV